MAHFAKIDENNVVLQVIAVHNDHEADGAEYCNQLLGGRWIQTSYHANFRKHFAGIGFTYDPIRDVFVPPKPDEGSWKFNEETCGWDEDID